MRKILQLAGLAAAATLALAAAPAARADANLKCTMTFTMKGWSLFYQTAEGHGTVHCSDGQSMNVKLVAKGGGITAGKYVETGRGDFSKVSSMDELLGSYVKAQAEAGAVNSAQAQAMTKGEVSLALSAKGQGWELGIAFGELKIER
ncbi:MAG TPA: hypothetical protein VMD03_05615 [Steroidobacteraceae bacterium]|nr:hypothetical protein [Steroidobacteraceae bacterium]